MIRSFVFAIVSGAIMAAAGPAFSADATMRFRDSGLTFNSNVLSFDGKTYSVETQLFGRMELDVEKFECVAGACAITHVRPVARTTPDFDIHGSELIGRYLMPLLIGGYAHSVDASAKLQPSSDVSELKIELADRKGGKLANVDLITHGSDAAFPALADGTAAIAVSARAINPLEAKMLPSVREHVLARDALVMIVSPDNPVSSISTEQIFDVFTGKISDWAQLGQAAGKINVYARKDGSRALEIFNSLAINVEASQITPDAKRLESDAQLSAAVAKDPRGIGFSSYASMADTKALDVSTVCGITHSPTAFNIKADEYPFGQNLYLYKGNKPSAQHAAGLVNYVKSAQAQRIISEAGFINRSLQPVPYQKQSSRIIKSLDSSGDTLDVKLMRTLIQQVEKLERLPVTFRFVDNSLVPDAQAQENMRRLAARLSKPDMMGRKVFLIGFSDAGGTHEKNRQSSAIRAGVIQQELLKLSNGNVSAAQLQVKGYGALVPVGCNDNSAGQAKNRRVEVWVGPQVVTASQDNQDNGLISTPSEAGQVQSAITDDKPEQLFRNFLDWKNRKQN